MCRHHVAIAILPGSVQTADCRHTVPTQLVGIQGASICWRRQLTVADAEMCNCRLTEMRRWITWSISREWDISYTPLLLQQQRYICDWLSHSTPVTSPKSQTLLSVLFIADPRRIMLAKQVLFLVVSVISLSYVFVQELNKHLKCQLMMKWVSNFWVSIPRSPKMPIISSIVPHQCMCTCTVQAACTAGFVLLMSLLLCCSDVCACQCVLCVIVCSRKSSKTTAGQIISVTDMSRLCILWRSLYRSCIDRFLGCIECVRCIL